MIITRTPLRVTLGGGGTDLPSYYERFGGFVLSAAIDKYIYIHINETFTSDYFLKYSALERVKQVRDIEHSIIREVLCRHDIGPGIELVSVADIPAGTGLGSSGSFTVGLLRAVYAFRHHQVTAGDLADEACQIEIDILGRPVGKQDQYIAAFGGLASFNFEPAGHVKVSPLHITRETLYDLEEHLLLFFTGYSRGAEELLTEQKSRSEDSDSDMLENLHAVKALGLRCKEALERGATLEFGELMHEHWLYKQRRSSQMSNDNVDRWYELGLKSGAVGGKLVGAGGGGFLLFYARDQDSLREAMSDAGLSEVRFRFDYDGSTPIMRG